MLSASFRQQAFRGRDDDVALDSTSFTHALNTDWTQEVDTNFRVRFVVEETNGASENVTWHLYFIRNGGTPTQVTTTSAVKVVDSANFAHEDATTSILGGTGTFLAGWGDDLDAVLPTTGNQSWSGNQYTEHEICLQIDSAQVDNNDTITLQIRKSGGTTITYNQTPTITVSEAFAPVLTAEKGTFTLTGQDAALSDTRSTPAGEPQNLHTAVNVLTTAYTVPSGAEKLIVLPSTEAGSLGPDSPTVTYGGVSLTKAVDRYTLPGTTGNNYAGIFYLDDPAPGTADIVVSGSGWPSTNSIIQAFIVNGLAEGGPEDTGKGSSSASSATSIAFNASDGSTDPGDDLVTASAGAWLLAALANGGINETVSLSGWTFISQDISSSAQLDTYYLADGGSAETNYGSTTWDIPTGSLRGTTAQAAWPYAATGDPSLAADAGSFSLTGRDAALVATRALAAEAGAFILTGVAATLTHDAAGPTLIADSGSFTLTGQAAGLMAARNLAAAPGAYTLTGQAAAVLAHRRLVAELGGDFLPSDWDPDDWRTITYPLVGQDAGLTATRRLTADTGSYSLSGQAVSLTLSKVLTAQAGGFNLTGQDVVLPVTRAILAATGSFTLTGVAATLVHDGADPILTADSGSFALTGQAAGLKAGRTLVAAAGSYSLTGQAAQLAAARALAAAAGAFALTGNDATLVYDSADEVLTAEPGIFVISGNAASLRLASSAAGKLKKHRNPWMALPMGSRIGATL